MRFDYINPNNSEEDCSLKPGIYKIINTYYNPPKIYIGQTSQFKTRWNEYVSKIPKGTESKYLCNDYKKCLNIVGNDDFLKFSIIEIMEGSTGEQRKEKETELISEVYDNQKLCYNIVKDTRSKDRLKYSNTPEETKEKKSKIMKLRMNTPEAKEKVSKMRKGKMASEETRKKLSDSHKGQKSWNKGVPMPEETKEKLSKANSNQIPWNKGIPMSEGTKEKVSKSKKGITSWNKGIPMSVSTKEKMINSKKGCHAWNKGKLASEETRKKLSDSHKGIKQSEESKRKKSKSLKLYFAEKKRRHNIIPQSLIFILFLLEANS